MVNVWAILVFFRRKREGRSCGSVAWLRWSDHWSVRWGIDSPLDHWDCRFGERFLVVALVESVLGCEAWHAAHSAGKVHDVFSECDVGAQDHGATVRICQNAVSAAVVIVTNHGANGGAGIQLQAGWFELV